MGSERNSMDSCLIYSSSYRDVLGFAHLRIPVEHL